MYDVKMMEHRKAVRTYLIRAGYVNPQLYFERMIHNTYASYWGDGLRRLEAFKDENATIKAYELAFCNM